MKPIKRLFFAVVLCAGIPVACNSSPDRKALNGTKWLGTSDSSGTGVRADVLMEFTDSTMSATGADTPFRYVLTKDTIVTVTDKGGLRMVYLGDSIKVLPSGFTFHRVR